jgi:predicted porin
MDLKGLNMKLLKNTITLALFSACAVPVMAANIDIYGKANLSLQSSDDGAGSYSEVKSNASRLGFKGIHALEGDLSVVYKLEFEVDMDGDSAKGDSISDRNQYIGLKGNFGEVLLGRNDTILKQAQGKIDQFNDLNGDIKHLFKGENRMADTVTYKTPKLNGFQFGVTYITENSVDGESAYSMGVFYGDTKLKKSPIYAALAYDSEVKGYDVTRAVIQGKVAGFVLGAMYQNQEKLSDGSEMDGMLASVNYKIDKVALKAQYQVADYDGGDTKTGVSVGVDYKLAKSTKLYGFYTSQDMDSEADQDYLGVGIEYKF